MLVALILDFLDEPADHRFVLFGRRLNTLLCHMIPSGLDSVVDPAPSHSAAAFRKRASPPATRSKESVTSFGKPGGVTILRHHMTRWQSSIRRDGGRSGRCEAASLPPIAVRCAGCSCTP